MSRNNWNDGGQKPEPERDVVREICDATESVLRAADHLVDEYTRHDGGHGTGVGMRAAEDRLIAVVKIWRMVSGGRSL